MSRKDLLGRDLDATENEIMEIYERLKALAARDDLAPCIGSNVRFATAAIAQIVTDLDLEWEHLYDIGV